MTDQVARSPASQPSNADLAKAGIKVKRWFRSDDYSGTERQLIAFGLARPGYFPGDPGRNRTMVTYTMEWGPIPKGSNYCKTNRTIQISCRGRDRFCVSIGVEPEEAERRWAAEHKQKVVDNRELRDAKLSLANMPGDTEKFRCDLISEIRRYMNVAVEFASKPSDFHGYMIDAEPILMAFDAIAEAILEAEVTFDPERHEQIAQGYRAVLAKHDGAFQRDLAQLVAPKPALLALIEGEAR